MEIKMGLDESCVFERIGQLELIMQDAIKNGRFEKEVECAVKINGLRSLLFLKQ